MSIFRFTKAKYLTPEDRRERSNRIIKKMGVTCHERLPLLPSSNEVTLKSLDTIKNRAIACLFSVQLACSIAEGHDYLEAREYFMALLQKYGVEHELFPKERALFSGDYTKQDVIDVVWTYETYWAIIWALGLISNKEAQKLNTTCNTERACAIVPYIKETGKLISTEKILDMLDLYYRYHWACVEKTIRPETEIKDLNSEVIMERRKGLEWLISDMEDWDDISLDT